MVVVPRINTQSSFFTIQDNPWNPIEEIDLSNYCEKDVDIMKLEKFIIPSVKRGDLLKELNDIQINRRTLFPDLDGLSAGMLSAEILRSRT
jgi:hypothetical protein